MATKRRPLNPNMNFRPGGPDIGRSEAKGKRPTAPPTSVKEILVMVILHVCKKVIFFDTNLKVALYLGSLFIVSLIGDFIPFPKSYFARSDNLFNVYFVKIGWGWTLLMSLPFVCMTSYTLCCGDLKRVMRNHFPRLFIATFFWFFWTKMFNIVETSFGRCMFKGFATKSACLKAGHLWNGFDISGHSFILIYSSLVLMEEARPIIKWEKIKDHLRNEFHDRNVNEQPSTNPLRYLSEEQILNLQFLYSRLTPIIRTLFIGMAMLQLLWDMMLVSTMLYYHRMIEKVISGIIAILTWYFTYRFWYPSNMTPHPAGSGCFLYQRDDRNSFSNKRGPSATMNNDSVPTGSARTTTQTNFSKFMGMPIYTKQRSTAAAATGNNGEFDQLKGMVS